MALDIGELVGKLRIDEKPMDKGLKSGEGKLREFGDKVTQLTMGIGIAAAGALAAGLLGALNQEAVGAKVAAQLGGSAEDARQYGAAAGKLYAEGWGESLESIGDALKAVSGSGLVAPGDSAALEDITRRAQILADVFGQDVNGSVRAVQQLIRNGLVPDAQSGFDLIAAGIQGGLDKSEDLLDTINEYSTQFRELGLTGTQTFGLLQQAVKAGARDTDTAADALKEFAIRSKDASTTSAAGFKALGLDAKKFTAIFAKGGPEATAALDTVLDRLRAMKDPVAQDAAAVALFGTKAEDLGNSLYAMDLTTATGAFENAAGAIQKAGDAVGQTDAAKLEAFKRQAQQMAAAVGADLIPHLKDMGKWVQQNQSWLLPLVQVLGAAALAITAVNLATKAWAATEAAFVAVKGISTAAQWLWNAALYASPITWIVLGILLLVGVIILIATKTTWFQDLWNWAWGGIKAAASAVWDWIKGTLWPGIVGVFKSIGYAASWLWGQISSFFGMIWGFLKSFASFVAGVFSAIGDFIAAGFQRGKDAARNAINSILGFVNNAIGGLNSLISLANKIPGVNIGSIGNIPRLASGGSVSPSNGRQGTVVRMGDGGQVEHALPDSAFRDYVREAVAAGGGHAEVLVQVELVGDGVLRIVRTEVHRKGVQTLEQTP